MMRALLSSPLKGLPRAIWLLLAVCVASGAALNLYRTALRPAGEPRDYRGFYPQEAQLDGETVRWARGFAKAEVPLYQWHPLRWTIRLTAPPEAPAAGASAWLLVNDVRVQRVDVGRGWHTVTVVSDVPPTLDLALQFKSPQYGPSGHGIGVGRIEVEPVFTIGNVSRACASGALAGLLLWLVCVLTPERVLGGADSATTSATASATASATPSTTASASASATASSPPSRQWPWPRALALLAIVWIYFAIWAVLKPPLQSPDETQHLLRAASVRYQPWATLTPDWITLDPRFVNPLVFLQPPQIGDLYFRRNNHLSHEHITFLKAMTWHDPLPPLTPIRTPLATYPPLYYGTVFGLAEATTALGQLTPYQNTYVYRAWTVVIAGLLWLAVYRALQITPGAARHVNALFAFLLLNTMLAFVSSSATPDAVNVPLATLAVLLTYRTLMTGRGPWIATAAIVACGLTKPTVLLLLGSLPVPILLAWRAGATNTRHVLLTALAAARAGLILFCLFYAWSPPRFLGSIPPRDLALRTYAMDYLTRLPVIWQSYWGMLGWLDYQLDWNWYLALLGLVLAIAVFVHRRRTPDEAAFAQFAAWIGVGYFVLMTLGEFWYLSVVGYNFQGRHLLPASIALAGLVLHDRASARWVLLAFLAVMNILLMHATIVRYYADGFAGFRASLPLW